MNIIELVWFLIWIFGGAALGGWLGGFPGMIVGLGAGVGAIWLISRFVNPYPNDYPACVCGANEISSFSLEEHQVYDSVHRCKKCGAMYMIRKGATWTRVLPDGTTELSMTRAFRGRWKRIQVVSDDRDGTRDRQSR